MFSPNRSVELTNRFPATHPPCLCRLLATLHRVRQPRSQDKVPVISLTLFLVPGCRTRFSCPAWTRSLENEQHQSHRPLWQHGIGFSNFISKKFPFFSLISRCYWLPNPISCATWNTSYTVVGLSSIVIILLLSSKSYDSFHHCDTFFSSHHFKLEFQLE